MGGKETEAANKEGETGIGDKETEAANKEVEKQLEQTIFDSTNDSTIKLQITNRKLIRDFAHF